MCITDWVAAQRRRRISGKFAKIYKSGLWSRLAREAQQEGDTTQLLLPFEPPSPPEYSPVPFLSTSPGFPASSVPHAFLIDLDPNSPLST
ncbi:hypothetical protein FOMPIDRAFT_82008 [Fomitopsis schrenkii]|uniref:Uncharacterized protein n=1 Tax=Fomitopsis schrenkii TaxID=2126942 RepID=S8EHY7_FOMSC|nr:hypothetical protein FOMPIDRAFT_82008 [Fomitopsis schrenkii]